MNTNKSPFGFIATNDIASKKQKRQPTKHQSSSEGTGNVTHASWGTGRCLGPNNLGNVNLCLYIYTSNVSLDVKGCAPASDEACVPVQQISPSW
jgi:hypothetical protein